jgi:hypothetical protein
MLPTRKRALRSPPVLSATHRMLGLVMTISVFFCGLSFQKSLVLLQSHRDVVYDEPSNWIATHTSNNLTTKASTMQNFEAGRMESQQNKARQSRRRQGGQPPAQRPSNGERPGGFIHLSKSGGSTLSLLIRNGCHSFVKKPCRNVTNETVASKLIENYYHGM